MLNCKEITHLLSDAQDRKLGWHERMRLRVHLSFCRGCRNFGRQLSILRAACKGYWAKDSSAPKQP